MTSGDQFRPTAPPALASTDYAAAVDQVRRLGSAGSTERTADQTAIANFWADGGGTSTPPGHWNQIAMDIGLEHNQSLLENARMLALVNFAMADAGIASWDAKYASNLWRPIDAIHLADTDGNAATTADAAWSPLLNTPSFPSYVSGHSTFSAAAAEVLTALLGENVAFTTRADPGSTGVWPPADDVAPLQVRSFDSFDSAAQEAGISRIYGGIHYSFDNAAGLELGHDIGQLVIASLLKAK
jgi:membrane-associated phospholipid phosphatase